MIWRWPSQNTFGMWTVLYWTRSSRTQFGVSINVWRLAGNTLNISCNFLYCNHRVHRDFSITLYFIYLYENHIFLQWLLDSLFDLMCFLSRMSSSGSTYRILFSSCMIACSGFSNRNRSRSRKNNNCWVQSCSSWSKKDGTCRGSRRMSWDWKDYCRSWHQVMKSTLPFRLCRQHNRLFILQSFDCLAAFHLELLQAILFIAI